MQAQRWLSLHPSWMLPSSINLPSRNATASSVRLKRSCCAVTQATSPLVITPVDIASKNRTPSDMGCSAIERTLGSVVPGGMAFSCFFTSERQS